MTHRPHSNPLSTALRRSSARAVVVAMTLLVMAAAWLFWTMPGGKAPPRSAIRMAPGSMPSTLTPTNDARGLVGGRGGTGPILERGGGLLVGFSVSTMNWSGHVVIKSLQAIYRDPAGATRLGKRFGHLGHNPQEVVAKEDYAVGALEARSGDRVNGFKVTFMRVAGDKLDPNDSYTSEWIGGTGGAGPVKMGGDGRAVVGIKVRYGNDLDALTIVQ